MNIHYKSSTSFLSTVLIFTFLLSINNLFAQNNSTELNSEKKEFIVNKISELLKNNYVFPEMAEKTGNYIQSQLSDGIYDNITDAKTFSETLTVDLQKITNDKHIRARTKKSEQIKEKSENPMIANFKENKSYMEKNYGFKSVQILENNVGYLDLRKFENLSYAKPTLVSAMKFLENCDAIIVDLRKNGGGHPDNVQYLCSYFFEEKTHLNSLYWREGNVTRDFYSLDDVEGKRSADRPLFILTSNYTFSGAEEFSYNMLTQDRATLIGETTGGGANPGRMFPVTPYMSVFIPTGKAINPITKTNWEGVGVEPQIKCSAEEAFDKGVKMAGDAALKYKDEKLKKMMLISDEMNSKMDKAEMEISNNKIATDLVNSALDLGFSNELLDENGLNNIGYKYLMADKKEMAIILFSYNVKQFPNSFNAYDSLGEAFMKSGKNDLAITSYKKSYELNNENKNALEMIKSMGGTL